MRADRRIEFYLISRFHPEVVQAKSDKRYQSRTKQVNVAELNSAGRLHLCVGEYDAPEFKVQFHCTDYAASTNQNGPTRSDTWACITSSQTSPLFGLA